MDFDAVNAEFFQYNLDIERQAIADDDRLIVILGAVVYQLFKAGTYFYIGV